MIKLQNQTAWLFQLASRPSPWSYLVQVDWSKYSIIKPVMSSSNFMLKYFSAPRTLISPSSTILFWSNCAGLCIQTLGAIAGSESSCTEISSAVLT
ncbi:hypothetical protein V6N12_068403 [Hibiscus sabdariffa]|uniref:Uncharacterized protein n=1 Tax=Hibiscus sabdariffa TaxID=183260 RepID=A0ABR2FPU9_9ROSI